MILILKKSASQEQVEQVISRLELLNLSAQLISCGQTPTVAIEDDVSKIASHVFSQIPGVDKVIRVQSQAKLSLTSEFQPISVGSHDSEIQIGSGLEPVFAAGPCSVEGQAQILRNARLAKEAGAQILRGGAYKPRSSPYEFQGLGAEGLRYLHEAKKASGLPVLSEVTSPAQVEEAESYVDILQVGARNMYNYELLKELGNSRLPVLLKRAMSATISEWLNAAEYMVSAGNQKIILCERGIRTFETQTRNTIDLNAVAVLKRSSTLPVFVDPSHGTGRADLVADLARAAIACGADGLVIEVHENPAASISDREQAISPEAFKAIVDDCRRIHAALNFRQNAPALKAPALELKV